MDKLLRLPLDTLKLLFSNMDLSLTVGPSDWKTVKAAAYLQDLTPEDGLAVLKGNEEKN